MKRTRLFHILQAAQKGGVEAGQKWAEANLKSKDKNSSRDAIIMEGRQKILLVLRQAQFIVAYFPTRENAANRAAASTRTSLHKHKNEENNDINVSGVTDGSYFR